MKKRVIALILSLLMFTGLFSSVSLKQVEASNTTTLKSKTLTTCVYSKGEISKDSKYCYFTWKCETTGTYLISTIGSVDTYGVVTKKGGAFVKSGNINPYPNNNHLDYHLTIKNCQKNNQYQICVSSLKGAYGNFRIIVRLADTDNIKEELNKDTEFSLTWYTEESLISGVKKDYENTMKKYNTEDYESLGAGKKIKYSSGLGLMWALVAKWCDCDENSLCGNLLKIYLENNCDSVILSKSSVAKVFHSASGKKACLKACESLATFSKYCVPAGGQKVKIYQKNRIKAVAKLDEDENDREIEYFGVGAISPYLSTNNEVYLSFGEYSVYLTDIKVYRLDNQYYANFNFNVIDMYDFGGSGDKDFLWAEELQKLGKVKPYIIKGYVPVTATWEYGKESDVKLDCKYTVSKQKVAITLINRIAKVIN